MADDAGGGEVFDLLIAEAEQAAKDLLVMLAKRRRQMFDFIRQGAVALVPDYGEIESTLPDAPSYFAFADHSIWLNVFAMRLSNDVNCLAPVIGICGANWFPVADSFDKFIEMYADDPMSIL